MWKGNVDDVETASLQRGDFVPAEREGLVCGIVEDLDFQPIARVVDRRHSIQKPLNDMIFIENR